MTYDRFRQRMGPYLFIMPTIVIIGVFFLVPMVKAVLLSLSDAEILRIREAKPVGFSNYIQFFTNGDLLSVGKATLTYVFFGGMGAYLVGLFTATMLNRDFWGRGVARSLLILPWMVPQVVLVIIWKWMLNPKYGVINFFLSEAGLITNNFSWFGNPTLAMTSVLVTTIWKEYPLAMLILLAGMKSIPDELYDAASVDGASAPQKFLHITLPGLRYVSTILILLLVIWHFQNFVIIWLLTQGGPADSTATLTIFTYLNAYKFGNLGYGATIGMVILVVTLFFSVIYYNVFIRNMD